MSDHEPIRAAGGLVWRDVSRRQLAVVHRPRYDDWCLPKGKLDPGEQPLAGALREVREETGLRTRLLGVARDLQYDVDGRPKVVHWFHLCAETDEFAVEDRGEVDRCEWWTVDRARRCLTYPSERGLLSDAVGPDFDPDR